MVYTVQIPIKLPSLNEYISAERTNRYRAAKIKEAVQNDIICYLVRELKNTRIRSPVILHYLWVEQNKRRDHDNVAFGQKFVQDAIVKAGYLHDDGWAYIQGFTHDFVIGKQPQLLLKIEEVI